LSFRKKVHSDADDDDHIQETGAQRTKQPKGKKKSLPEPPPPVCLPPLTEPAVSQSLSREAVTVVAHPVTPTTASAASSAAVALAPAPSTVLPVYPSPGIISSSPFQSRSVVVSPVANAMPIGPSTSTLRVRWPQLPAQPTQSSSTATNGNRLFVNAALHLCLMCSFLNLR